MTRIEQARSRKITRRQVVKIEQGRLTDAQAHAVNERLGRSNPPDYPRHVEQPINTATKKVRRKRRPHAKP
jgi:cell envelope opacity-associated protein A